jgi:hypothetical protein
MTPSGEAMMGAPDWRVSRWRTACQAGLAAILATSMTACSDGYSTAELGVSARPHTTEPADIVDQLNRMNRDSLTTSRWRFSFSEPCELTLQARRPGGESEVLTVSLQHSHVQVKGNVDSDSHGVALASPGAPELDAERVYEAQRWTDAVAYATQLHALRRGCPTDP